MITRLPVAANAARAGLFLVCLSAPVDTEALDLGIRSGSDWLRWFGLVMGATLAIGSLLMVSTSALVPLGRMPLVAFLSLPLFGLLFAAAALDPAAALHGAALFLFIGCTVGVVVGTYGLGVCAGPLLAALVIQLAASIPVEAFGPPVPLEQYFAADEGLSGLGKFQGVFADPNAAGRAGAITLVLWVGHRHRAHWSGILPAALGLGILLASQSRTAWLATAFVVVVAALHRRASRLPRRAVFTAVPLVLAALVAVVVRSTWLRGILERDANPGELFTLTGRTQIWAAGVRAWVDRPVRGYGFGNVPFVFAEARRLGEVDNAVAYAHNGVLQILLMSGVVGAVALGAGLLWLWRRVEWSAVPLGTITLGVLLLVMNLTESVFTTRIDWTDIGAVAVLADLGRWQQTGAVQ